MSAVARGVKDITSENASQLESRSGDIHGKGSILYNDENV